MTDHAGSLLSKFHRHGNVYFLMGYDDQGGIVVCDGGHHDKTGVAEALELHKRLALRSTCKVAFWKMAFFTDVPGFSGELNEEAIESCNEMLAHSRRLA